MIRALCLLIATVGLLKPALAEEIVDGLVQANKALIGGILNPDETEQLATLLRKLSLGLADRQNGPGDGK